MGKICHTCKGMPASNSLASRAVQAVQDHHLRKFYPTRAELTTPRGYNARVIVDGLTPGKKVFYFATTGADPISDNKILLRGPSYDKLQNSGVVIVGDNGTAVFKVNCPRVYMNPENHRAYPRHVHFVYEAHRNQTPDMKPWALKLYTRKIFCPVTVGTLNHALKTHAAVVIDALPAEYYSKEHIKGAANIPHDHLHDIDAKTVEAVLKTQNPTLFSAHAKAGTVKHIPIILYCYSPECNAAEHLKEHLDRLGFVNTWHYEGGISQWKGPKAGSQAPVVIKSSRTYAASSWTSPDGKKHTVEKAMYVSNDSLTGNPSVTYVVRRDGRPKRVTKE